MPTDVVTMAAIENAVVSRLKAKGLQDVKEIDGVKSPENLALALPAVWAAVQEGSFGDNIGGNSYKQTVKLHVYVIFQQMKDEKERRHGVYLIIEGIIGILTLQKLGLEIHPLRPVSFKNITGEEERAAALMVYDIEFETWYRVNKMDDEAAADLLKIGLNYYLKPGDNIIDASDLVTLNQ